MSKKIEDLTDSTLDSIGDARYNVQCCYAELRDVVNEGIREKLEIAVENLSESEKKVKKLQRLLGAM